MEYRIAIMGDEAVGKTSLVSRFLFNKFPEKHDKTIEDLLRRKFILNGASLTIDILDTAGCKEYPEKTVFAMSSCNAFLLVFSVESIASFDRVRSLREQIIKIKNSAEIPMVMVANKIDKETREVANALGELTANFDYSCGYVETSAKENKNVEEAFKQLLRQTGDLNNEQIDEFFLAQ